MYKAKPKFMLFNGTYLKHYDSSGIWVAQSVKRPISAPVVISWFVGSRPTLGSVLTARSLEPASDSVSVSASLFLCPYRAHALSLSLSKTNIKKKEE